MTTVLSYGGGRQTVALCVLVARGVLPKPDRIVMADTGREKPTTFAYLDEHVRPLLAPLGLEAEVARGFKRVDLHDKHGAPLMPVFTERSKLRTYCSSEWKRDALDRYLRGQGVSSGVRWIGFALDETDRIKTLARGRWESRFPLVELMLTKAGCREVIRSAGLPMPLASACWCCPNLSNSKWREVRDQMPGEFAAACSLDDELRAEDIERGGSGVWLHRSRVPLREADLDAPETAEPSRQCGLGMCFV